MNKSIKAAVAAIFGLAIGVSSVSAYQFGACEENCITQLNRCIVNDRNEAKCFQQFMACRQSCQSSN